MNLLELFESESEFLATWAGETLFSEGENGKLMYVLIEGLATIVVQGKVVETAEPGTIVGEMALIDSSPRAASVIAKSDCKWVAIEPEGFRFLVRESPEFAIHVMHVMASRLRHLHGMMI